MNLSGVVEAPPSQASETEAWKLDAITGRPPARGPAPTARAERSAKIEACLATPRDPPDGAHCRTDGQVQPRRRGWGPTCDWLESSALDQESLNPGTLRREMWCVGQEGSAAVTSKQASSGTSARTAGAAWDCAEVGCRRSSSSSSWLPLRWRSGTQGRWVWGLTLCRV